MRMRAFLVLAVTLAAACGGDTESPSSCNGVANGTACGAGQICISGACVASRCGDGVAVTGEECDDGNQAGNDGCETSCRFSCVASDPARGCAAGDACAGASACSADHICVAGTPLPDGAACGDGQSCASNVCRTVCGDNRRGPGEECDDDNTNNLDGCDSTCKVEQVARVTSLQQQFAPDEFCTKNALGEAISAQAQPIIQATWDQPVGDGSLSIVFKFLGAIDTSGARSLFKLGFVDALPIRFGMQEDGTFTDNYTGVSDVDWWYYLNSPASVDASGTPISQLDGEVTNRRVTAGPGTIENLRLLFALQPTTVTLFNVRIDATFDAPLTKPKLSTTGKPGGHLPSENLSPTFTTYESSGIAEGASPGAMCSDVSARSLADTVMPGLLTLCADPSDPDGNTPMFSVGNPERPDNHLLDAFIVGCQFFSFDAENNPAFVPTIIPAQPDGSRDGSTYVFDQDPITHQVTRCTKDGQPADLTTCYANATYSAYFKFAADRVILRADKPPILP